MGTDYVWKDRHIAILRKYHEQGYSATLIAEEIKKETGEDFSRNSVLGKIHRFRLEKKKLEDKPEKKKIPTKIALHKNKSHSLAPRIGNLIVITPLLPPDEVAKHPVSLLEITEGLCKWIVAEPAMMCADPVAYVGCSYCQHHRLIGTYRAVR